MKPSPFSIAARIPFAERPVSLAVPILSHSEKERRTYAQIRPLELLRLVSRSAGAEWMVLEHRSRPGVAGSLLGKKRVEVEEKTGVDGLQLRIGKKIILDGCTLNLTALHQALGIDPYPYSEADSAYQLAGLERRGTHLYFQGLPFQVKYRTWKGKSAQNHILLTADGEFDVVWRRKDEWHVNLTYVALAFLAQPFAHPAQGGAFGRAAVQTLPQSNHLIHGKGVFYDRQQKIA